MAPDAAAAATATAESQRIFREVLAGWFTDLLEARRQGLLDFSWQMQRPEEAWHAAAA
jgi:hypothetical protein